MTIIEVEHVTKEYRLGAIQGLKQTVLNSAARLTGKKIAERPLFKALDDVSFSIEPGEVVGIIGHNGAGKSTLLKLLARISTPTHGRIKIGGRIAPLIEVGAGFVPDFTGRENVYLNGAILGMSRMEIDKKFDEIVQFSEMEDFIDTPVKRYSSGMQVKLAFSVATSVEAEILIVDEVLAVGDLAFQRKCFTRMENMIKEQGRTVLLVSHNIRQVERICTRTLMLDHGTIFADGDPKKVCNLFYEESDLRIQANAKEILNSDPTAALRGTGEASLISLRLHNQAGQPVESINNSDSVSIELTFESHINLINPVFAVGFHTVDLLYVATPRSVGSDLPGKLSPEKYTVTCHIDALPLLPGPYALRVSLSAGETPRTILYAENLWHFNVTSVGFERSMVGSEGLISLPATWDLASQHATSTN